MPETDVESLQTHKTRALEDILPTTREREEVLSIMDRANQIAGMADPEGMTQGMLDLLIEITQADSANFFQLDEGTDELVITHVRGDAESQYLIGLRLNRQQGMPGRRLNRKLLS